MRYILVLVLFLIYGVSSDVANAQYVEKKAQQVINREGESCPEVTDVRGAATIEGGEAFVMAVACSDGSQHALKVIEATEEISYISSCFMLESKSNNFECFKGD